MADGEGAIDLPISAQGLPAVCLEGLSASSEADLSAVFFIRWLCGGMAGSFR